MLRVFRTEDLFLIHIFSDSHLIQASYSYNASAHSASPDSHTPLRFCESTNLHVCLSIKGQVIHSFISAEITVLRL